MKCLDDKALDNSSLLRCHHRKPLENCYHLLLWQLSQITSWIINTKWCLNYEVEIILNWLIIVIIETSWKLSSLKPFDSCHYWNFLEIVIIETIWQLSSSKPIDNYTCTTYRSTICHNELCKSRLGFSYIKRSYT